MKKISAILATAVIIASCSSPQSNEHHEQTPAIEYISSKELKTSETAKQTSFTINKKNGEFYANVGFSGDAATISHNGIVIQTDVSGSKKAYKTESGNVLAKIKDNGSTFKLKDKNGNLKWKIKIYEDKIKISDNEENKNPYVIKTKSTEKAKVYKNDQEIGFVKFKKEKGNSIVESNNKTFIVTSNSLNAPLLTMLCPQIPEKDQLIIMAELFTRGQ